MMKKMKRCQWAFRVGGSHTNNKPGLMCPRESAEILETKVGYSETKDRRAFCGPHSDDYKTIKLAISK